jgi:putative spermidine/putrescine transport system permease protein
MLTCILFFAGLVEGFIQSLGLTSIYDVSQISFKHYEELLKSSEFWDCFFLTIKISIISTLISVFLGLFIIFLLFIIKTSKYSRFTLVIKNFFQIPMLFPYLVSGYIIFMIFTQSGWISSILFNMGIIEKITDFPVIINDEFGFGIIIAYIWKTSPFVVLMLFSVVLKVESSWVELGYMLGASRFNFFKEVIFPLLISPLKISSFIIFTYTFADFEIPFLLGVTYPKMISVYSYQIYMNGNLIDRPKALAINVLTIIIILSIGAVFYFFEKKNIHERRK